MLTDFGSDVSFGHRHVIQQRLKLAGCWWKETHAQAMLNLRVARGNQLWNSYWSNIERHFQSHPMVGW